MLMLEARQVCHLSNVCPYANECWGAREGRDTKFTCEFVTEDGSIEAGRYRNPLDKTGKMKVIME